MNGQSHAFGHKPPGSPAPSAKIGAVAGAVADRARALGLTVLHLRISKIAGSPTRHLCLRDRQRRDWFIRFSDHLQPRCTGHEKPHFDLVMRDGETGAELAFGFVARVARGEERWWPAERAPGRKRGRAISNGPSGKRGRIVVDEFFEGVR